MPVRYGLIGYPLTHSFSPDYFARKFSDEKISAIYERYELENLSELPSLLDKFPDLKGLNVTIPYKQTILPYLHELSDAAQAVGAVNCIDINNGKLTGYNTDVIGFEKSLLPLLKPQHQKALVLGTGGSSLAVKFVLKRLGIAFLPVSRKEKEGVITYETLNDALIKDCYLIINTTPLGMFPAVEKYPPIPYESLTPNHLLYDLVYNPETTTFLSLGMKKGAVVKNGLEMLHLQAEASWDIWNHH